MSEEFAPEASLISNFPFSFRGNQEWTIKEIAKHINKPEINFIVVQAPTGSGKSPLAMSLAKSVKNSYILTSNKILQDQYVLDFGDELADLRGRSNYQCSTHPTYDCANSPCRIDSESRKKCSKERACQYHNALSTASTSKITSFNFAAGLSFLNYGKKFIPRDVLIIDEAHMIQDNATSFIEFTISGQQLDEWDLLGKTATIIPKYSKSEEYLPWLELLSNKAKSKLNNFEASTKIDKMLGKKLTYEKLEQLYRKLVTIITELTEYGGNLVLDLTFADTDQTIVDKISFKPLDVSRYCKEKLFNFGKKTVLMSATIINYKEFIKSIGIEESESVFIDVPSTFPKENRPIIKQYIDAFNYKNLQIHMPKIIEHVEDVLKNHSNEKGIIHTHSYDTAKKIYSALNKKFPGRLLFPEQSSKQADILAQHKASKTPTVLLSPSMTEGVDLKDDLSRFQIIVKVPYPSLGDKIVSARMAKNNGWYAWKTLLTIIQAYGRSTRSETDHSVTYIFDASFEQLLMRNRKSLPTWFLEAIM